MRFLIISREGESLGLGRRLEKEGHTVNVHIVRPECRRKGVGVVPVIQTPRPIVDAEGVYNISAIEHLMNTALPDITIFDTPDMPTMATRMIGAGRRVIGAAGDIPQLLPQGGPCGTAPYIEAWFNGQDFIAPFALHAVAYNLMDSSAGPYVPGGSGSITVFVPRSSGAALLLISLTSHFRESSYRGPVRLNLNTEDVTYGLGPTCFALYESIHGTISQFLLAVANGTPYECKTLSDAVATVRVTLPPFPYSGGTPTSVHGVNDGNLKHLWFNDLTYAGGSWSTTGQSNDLGFVTARGESVREAVRRAYRTIENLRGTEFLQFRSDIGRDRPAQEASTCEERRPRHGSSSSTLRQPQTSVTPGESSNRT